MDSEVIFECRYGSDSFESKAGISCGDIAFIMGINALFLFFGICAKSFGLIFFVLLMVVILTVHFYRYCREHDDAKIQVTQKKLQIIGRNGRIERSFDLRDITKIYAVGSSAVIVRVPLDPFAPRDDEYTEYTLDDAADNAGVVMNVLKQIAKLNTDSEQISESGEQIPAEQPQFSAVQQRDLTEDEADAFHAAQHLLNQGMISDRQYEKLLEPQTPEPDAEQPVQTADINSQNAADYMQRQAMLAQQLETAPQSVESEKEKEYGRAGLV